MISAPSNFNHISHIGPGDGIQNQRLIDLPTTLETADSKSNLTSPHPSISSQSSSQSRVCLTAVRPTTHSGKMGGV